MYKKLFLSFSAIVFTIVAALALALLYLYHHPATLKTIIEKSLSSKTGWSLKIEDLAYSIRPLSLQVRNITINTSKDTQDFGLRVAQLDADFDLSGSFGSRKLDLKQFNVTEFSIDLESGQNLFQFTGQTASPTAFNRILRWLVRFFLFKDIQIQSAEASNGRICLQSAGQQLLVSHIHASFKPDQLAISGRAAINWLTSDAVVTVAQFQASVDPGLYSGKSIIGGRIHFPEVVFKSPIASAESIRGNLSWTYNSALKNIKIESLSLQSQRLTLPVKTGKAIVINDLFFNTSGIHHLAQNRINLSNWRLKTKNLFDLKGSAVLNLQLPHSLKIGFAEGRLASRKLISIYKDVTGSKSLPINLSGPIGLTGNLGAHKAGTDWAYQGDLTVKLSQNRIAITTDQIRLDGRLTGSIRAVGQPPTPDLSVVLSGENLNLTVNGATLKAIAANVSLTGSFPEFRIADLEAWIPRASFAVGQKDYRIDNIDVRLQNGLVHMKSGRILCPEILLSSSVLKNLRMSVNGQKEQVLINLQAKDSRILEGAVTLGILPSDWKFSGHDSMQATAVIKQGGWSTISSKLTLTELNFNNSDESCLAENIRVSAETSTMVHMRDKKFKGTFSFVMPNGEILYNKIYLDLAQNEFSTSGSGTYQGHSQSLQIAGITLKIKDLLTLDIHGSLDPGRDQPELDLFINLPKTAAQPIFTHFIAEPYQYKNPALADLKVDGLISGRWNVVRSGSDWTVKGKASWQQGSLKFDKTGVSLEGIDLNLPVWFQSDKQKSGSEILRGRLAIQKMKLPFLPEQPVTIPLRVTPESIAATSETRLLFHSGDVVFEPFVCRKIYEMRPSIETGIRVNSIQLGPLLNGIWPNPTKSVIGGKLDRINFDGNSLTSRGTITAKIFGGQILVLDPGVSGLSSATPALRLNAIINDLKLADLTEDTAFGRIQGVIAGYINNLEIVNGQPQKFDLRLKTHRKKDVPQKINVRAVENIAHIGVGQSPFMGLAGTFVSIFKEFSYKKIGVAASLQNDVFKINGTIKENGVEYLVRRGGIPGVDIVNLNPDNRISFKDMLKRIKRIKGSQGSPVIR